MKISKLQVGQVLYGTERRKMGNTTTNTTTVFPIKVTEIDPEGNWVLASWNHNRPQKFRQTAVNRWKLTKPVLTTYAFGHARLATKAEIAIAAAQAAGAMPVGDRCLTHDIPFDDARVGSVPTKACWKCRKAID
jgi:hypothetical protein